jgi:hypothetical protein
MHYGCDREQFGKYLPTFLKNLLLPLSGEKLKPCILTPSDVVEKNAVSNYDKPSKLRPSDIKGNRKRDLRDTN